MHKVSDEFMNISLKANDFMRREQGQRQEQIL